MAFPLKLVPFVAKIVEIFHVFIACVFVFFFFFFFASEMKFSMIELLITCDDGNDVLADRLSAGDGLVGDRLPSTGGIAVEGELML